MSDIKDGGPAFPESASGPYPNGEIVEGRPGMSLRDYFAGQALAGWLSSWTTNSSPLWFEADHVSAAAYDYADAMIKAREVKP